MPRLNDKTAQEIAVRIVDQAIHQVFDQEPSIKKRQYNQLVKRMKTTLLDNKRLHSYLEKLDNRTLAAFEKYAAENLVNEGRVYQKREGGSRVYLATGRGKVNGALKKAREEKFYSDSAQFVVSILPQKEQRKFKTYIADAKQYGVDRQLDSSPLKYLKEQGNLHNDIVRGIDASEKEMKAKETDPTSMRFAYKLALEVSDLERKQVFLTNKDKPEYIDNPDPKVMSRTFEGRKYLVKNELMGQIYGLGRNLVKRQYTTDEPTEIIEAYNTVLDQYSGLLNQNRKNQEKGPAFTLEERQELVGMVNGFQQKVMDAFKEKFPEEAAAYRPFRHGPEAFEKEMGSFKGVLEQHLEGKSLQEQKAILERVSQFMEIPERIAHRKGTHPLKHWDACMQIEFATQFAVEKAGGKETEEGKMLQELGNAVARLESKGLRTEASGAVIVTGEGNAQKRKPIPSDGKAELSEITASVNSALYEENLREPIIDIYTQAWELYAKSGQETVDFNNPTWKQLKNAYQYAVENKSITLVETVQPSEDRKAFAAMQDGRLVEAVKGRIHSEHVVGEAIREYTHWRLEFGTQEDAQSLQRNAEAAQSLLDVLKQNPNTRAEKGGVHKVTKDYHGQGLKSYLEGIVAEYEDTLDVEKGVGDAAESLAQSQKWRVMAQKKGEKERLVVGPHTKKVVSQEEGKGKEKEL